MTIEQLITIRIRRGYSIDDRFLAKLKYALEAVLDIDLLPEGEGWKITSEQRQVPNEDWEN